MHVVLASRRVKMRMTTVMMRKVDSRYQESFLHSKVGYNIFSFHSHAYFIHHRLLSLHAEPHTFQLRAYLYQAREMYASDKSGLSGNTKK